jgi:transposase
MKNTQGTLNKAHTMNPATLYMAFELSNSKWKIGFSDGNKTRLVSVAARDLEGLQVEIGKAKNRFRLADNVRVVSCYEAGRDGFWLHRYLSSCGIENLVVDSASLEVNRRKRRAKTDRIDATKLLNMLMRYHWGETKLWSVVNVPGVESEDARHLNREFAALKKERTMHRNRIRGLLIQHGIQVGNPSKRNFLQELESFRTWDGQRLGKDLKARVEREYERLRIVEQQILSINREKKERLKNPDTESLRKVAQLQLLNGIGEVSSWDFVMEFFGWRDFHNRKEVGQLAGVTPTPYDSGDSVREQGISKAGNKRIRALSVEIAWSWLRYQPGSKLSRWYNTRFGGGGKRMRRIGIVALARQLLIALWRYLEFGIVPEGATIKYTVGSK